MSTTKNEQYHILSPEWLRTNPLPEGDVFYRTKGYTHWCEFDRSFHRTDFMVAAQLNEYEFATQRTDLPPEAYATPPTDTTGSGREGETGCGPKSGHCAECGTTEGALVLLEDTTLCEECNMADHVVKLRLIDELTAQVEALRRPVAAILARWDRVTPEMKAKYGGIDADMQALRAAIDSAQRQEGMKAD